MIQYSTWMEPVSNGITALSLAHSAVQASPTLRQRANRIYNWLRQGNQVIPVFGPGGAGKTTIGRLLSGEDPFELVQPYSESWVTEKKRLPGHVPGYLLVAPGQLARKERAWPELLSAINEHRSPVIINVVSYGYHSFSVPSYTELDVAQDGQSEDEFLGTFTDARRSVEETLLRDLLAGIRYLKHPICMITVVNKQDLWWKDQKEVRKWYTDGPYGAALNDFASQVGKKAFQHEFVPLSSVVSNLTTPSNEMLAPTCQGYDQNIHLSHLGAFFDRISVILQGTVK